MLLSPTPVQCAPVVYNMVRPGGGGGGVGGGGGGQRKLPAVTRSDSTFLPSDLHPDHLRRCCHNTEN